MTITAAGWSEFIFKKKVANADGTAGLLLLACRVASIGQGKSDPKIAVNAAHFSRSWLDTTECWHFHRGVVHSPRAGK